MAKVLADFDTAHTGVIHDAQLDPLRVCLATASADGHVRLWDVRKPQEPTFVADLDAHCGPVTQVAWAPAGVGVLLATAGSDGMVAIWGRRVGASWHSIRQERLEGHGVLTSVAWAPSEHGAVIACGSEDGSVTVLRHLGATATSETTVEHRWQVTNFQAHRAEVSAVSWASAPDFSTQTLGMKGAQLATAGSDGIRVWRWEEARGAWEAVPVDQDRPSEEAAAESTEQSAPAKSSVCLPTLAPQTAFGIVVAPAAAAGAGASCGLEVGRLPRDVAWRPFAGFGEMLASAAGHSVFIWTDEGGRWRARQRVDLGDEVWKVSWAPMGNILLASFGAEVQRTALLKQSLDGTWDIMDIKPIDG